jgi:hypothetical protein
MERRRLLVDLAAGAWVLIWIAVAVQVAAEVRGLRDLSTTVTKTGAAVRESGAALRQLEGLPVVGGELSESARRVEAAGQSAVRSGRSSRESIHDLSLLLALAIGIIPSVAVLGVYLTLRENPSRSRTSVS